MKILGTFISWIIAQLGLSLICLLMYNNLLIDLFKIEISYIQWFAIIIISSCILPEGKILKARNNNNDTMSSLDKYVSTIFKKNDK